MTARLPLRAVVIGGAALWPFLVPDGDALRVGLIAVALALVGFGLTVAVGWMRVLALHLPGAAGLGVLTTAALLAGEQGLPVALIASAVVGGVAGALPVALVLPEPRRLLPFLSLLLTFAVWGIILPTWRPPTFNRPVVFGLDLAGDRPLYLAALALALLGWHVLDNLDRAELGRRLRVLGSSPPLLERSGVAPEAIWLAGGALAGCLAALGGAVLALTWQGMPDPTQLSPAFAVALLVVPILAGMRWPLGGLAGVLVLVVLSRWVPLPAGHLAVAGALVAALAVVGGDLPQMARWWRHT